MLTTRPTRDSVSTDTADRDSRLMVGDPGFARRLGRVRGVQIGWACFFFFTICALGFMPIVVVDESHTPAPRFCAQHSTVIDSIDGGCNSFHLSSYENRGSFTAFPRYHVTCIQLSWSTTSALRFPRRPQRGCGKIP